MAGAVLLHSQAFVLNWMFDDSCIELNRNEVELMIGLELDSKLKLNIDVCVLLYYYERLMIDKCSWSRVSITINIT